MFYQWFITPKGIKKIDKNYKGTCWKCKQMGGTFYYMWWTCKKMEKYWKEIHAEMQEMLKIKFSTKAETMLLGILPENTERLSQDLFGQMITVARVILATSRKVEECPS